MVTNSTGKGRDVITLLGVPFDGTSSYRSGSRFFPNSVREAFLNIEVYSQEDDLDLENVNIRDLGNLRFTSNVDQMIKEVSKVVSELLANKETPAILGGEHLITLASFNSFQQDTGLVVFDAHFDLREEYGGDRLSHASFLRRLLEERGHENVVHVGGRAASRDEWKFLKKRKIKNISTQMIQESGKAKNLLREYTKDLSTLYVSVDIDVLDPAYAPGAANPEPAGISTYQLISLLKELRGKRIIGFDIVEGVPSYDIGSSTAAAAAKVLAEITYMICKSQKSRKVPST